MKHVTNNLELVNLKELKELKSYNLYKIWNNQNKNNSSLMIKQLSFNSKLMTK